MEEQFRIIASFGALMLEAAVVLIVACGAIEALTHIVRYFLLGAGSALSRRELWLRFASWILLALEFALAADVVRTAIAPTWDDIGKLAAIATVRTLLSFFLDRDIQSMRRQGEAASDKAGSA
ncbi:Uncharacterized membrane protein [Sphingomonas laterariae]|uniref:Uncharacterized membrane protein n=1 Tax=Edaphosphingomonas laterariae TaxID=861865 RepID=A0A239EJ14_9SPHN|nr:DUF1622 domain-containing protein [Sphingomonas laterariae]SNS44268.1 Uncharacterized membrane protein [Sphingomonas laterariae]